MSDRTSKAIDLIAQRMFFMNRLCDNAVVNMSINWAMVNASLKFHHRVAHIYPVIADKYSDIQDAFNVRTMYLETPAYTREYATLLECMQDLLDELMITNDVIIDAIEIAKQEGDYNVKVLLEKNLADLTDVISQHIIFRDKAQLYQDRYASFDKDFDIFLILKEEY